MQIAGCLISLTSTTKPFQWTSKVQSAFISLKDKFTSNPVLIHPDSSKLLAVEVDAFEVSVGAVLSHCSDKIQ